MKGVVHKSLFASSGAQDQCVEKLENMWNGVNFPFVPILLLLSLLAAASRVPLAQALFVPVPTPEKGVVTLCVAYECFERVHQEAQAEDQLLVTLMISDFGLDPYVAVYLGWMTNIFEADAEAVGGSYRAPHVLLMEPSTFVSAAAARAVEAQFRSVYYLERSRSLRRQQQRGAGAGVDADMGLGTSGSSGSGSGSNVNVGQAEAEWTPGSPAEHAAYAEAARVAQVRYATKLLLRESAFANASLPWVFVCLEHGMSAFGLQELLTAQGQNLHTTLHLPRAILHLNHEQPWNVAPDSPGYIYPDVRHLQAAYDKFAVVLRNYYYAPLNKQQQRRGAGDERTSAAMVLFVPAGVPFYGYALGSRGSLGDVPVLAASARAGLCYFSGRSDYATRTRIEVEGDIGTSTSDSGSGSERIAQRQLHASIARAGGDANRTASASASTFASTGGDEASAEAQAEAAAEAKAAAEAEAAAEVAAGPGEQRRALFRLIEHKTVTQQQQQQQLKKGGVLACDLELHHGPAPEYGDDKYHEYLSHLAGTVFALCPPGNNPETFRIYEALESGAVPVLVRPAGPADFTQAAMWGGEGRGRHGAVGRDAETEAGVGIDDSPLPTNGEEEEEEGEGEGDNRTGSGSDIRSTAYPGPIFDTWEDVDAFLVQMAPVAPYSADSSSHKYSSQQAADIAVFTRKVILDNMQREVMEWYAAMKSRNRRRIATALREAFRPEAIIADLGARLQLAERRLLTLSLRSQADAVGARRI